ncbi:hypothetical protein GPX91_04040 [Streptococcus thermophilus]|nr:hypothetical protein [Streptococcus thermophilus]MCE2356363.1 hypothetical protein [Streptococcus thermophilus]
MDKSGRRNSSLEKRQEEALAPVTTNHNTKNDLYKEENQKQIINAYLFFSLIVTSI